jgi:Ala-tRNA(Pro) deacylase
MITCLERLQNWLHDEHVPHAVQQHREVFTADEVATEVHEKGDHVAKVVMAKIDGQLAMLVVPTTEQVDVERAAQFLKARQVTIAHEADFEGRFADCELGAMPPFGQLYDLPLYIDEALTRTSKLVFQAGSHRTTLKLATEDYLRLAHPIVSHLTHQFVAAGAA